jgi:hypothetical protein
MIFVCLLSCFQNKASNDGSELFKQDSIVQSPIIDNEVILSKLKETSFVFSENEKINPINHELVKKMNKENLILEMPQTIDAYKIKDGENRSEKYPDFEFQIWEFKNESTAKESFLIMKEAVSSSSFFEKPPKHFFVWQK